VPSYICHLWINATDAALAQPVVLLFPRAAFTLNQRVQVGHDIQMLLSTTDAPAQHAHAFTAVPLIAMYDIMVISALELCVFNCSVTR
jgi:hypothetical protein